MMPLRVLIIAGDPLARAGLAALLASEPQLTIVGQLAPGADFAAQMQIYQPDAMLWDLGWNPTANLEMVSDLTESGRPLVALLADESSAAEVWTAGVRGLLLRAASGELLAAALMTIAHGLIVLDPGLAGALLRAPSIAGSESPAESLTPRELDVLRGLADGLSNKEIARTLGISEHTVKFHVNAILGKLGAQSRTEAVVRATRAGLILL
jgi:two-component system nitrate/nitrite response regulator NarL